MVCFVFATYHLHVLSMGLGICIYTVVDRFVREKTRRTKTRVGEDLYSMDRTNWGFQTKLQKAYPRATSTAGPDGHGSVTVVGMLTTGKKEKPG